MNELLCDLYACAEAPHRWQGLLDQVCERMTVRSAALQVWEYGGGRLRRVWEARDSYSHAHRERHDRLFNNDENPRLRAGPADYAAVGRALIRDEDVFAPDSAELAEIRRRLAAVELGDNIRGVADLQGGRSMALLVHRSADDPRPIGAAEEGLLAEIIPHVRQAVGLMDRLQAATARSELLAEASDLLGIGIVLCDAQARVLWSNAAAEAVLERSPVLTQNQGRLRAGRAGDRPSLKALLANAARLSGMPVQLTLGREEPGEAVQLLALGAEGLTEALWSADGSAVLLLLCEPGRRLNVSPEAVAELFGLSRAEARLTAGLCEGLSLVDYAAARGISVGTARIQLKRALAKTASPRQSELVRRVCASLAANLAPDAEFVSLPQLVGPAGRGRPQ